MFNKYGVLTVIFFITLIFNSTAQNKNIQQQIGEIKGDATNQYLTDMANLRVPETRGKIYKKAKTIVYTWKFSTSQWGYNRNLNHTYNTKALETLNIGKDTVLNKFIDRYSYSYDAHDNLSNSAWEMYNATYQIWDTAGGTRSSSIYDGQGRIIQNIIQEWDPKLKWQNVSKDNFTFPASGTQFSEHILSRWDTFTDGWAPVIKDTAIVWENGHMVSYLEKAMYMIGWVDYVRYSAKYTGNNFIYVWENYDGVSKWDTTQRTYHTEMSNGGYQEISEIPSMGSWLKVRRYTFNVDTHGNNTGFESEEWTGSAWQVYEGRKTIYTYNANDVVTEKVEQQFDNYDKVYYNQYKYVYSNFIEFNVGIKQKEFSNLVEIYPNPARDNIYISFNLSQPEPITIQVSNSRGQMVYSENEMGTTGNYSKVLDASRFAGGVYMIQVKTGDKTVVKKVIVQK